MSSPIKPDNTRRDPRLDPIEGDVTRTRDGTEFYVRRIGDDGSIWYQEFGGGDLLDCDLESWREWAATDVVIAYGDAKETTSEQPQ